MDCVKDCYFQKDFHHIYYCDLYDKILDARNVRCKECENHETIYYTRIKEYAEKRVDNFKKTKR